MDISLAFETFAITFQYIIRWMQVHGFTLFGVYYSFFDIEIAGLVVGFVLTHLPVWGDTEFEFLGDDDT